MADLREASWEQAESQYINLCIGQPHPDLMPGEMLSRAAAEVFEKGAIDKRHALQYAANLGTKTFHSALATFLSQEYEHVVAREELMTTNGCSQALELACQCFAKAGDTIVLEDPCYHYAFKIFQDNHLKIVNVAQDPAVGSFNVDAFESALRAGSLRPRLVYVIPSFQNPAGATMPREARVRLIRLAAEFDFLILADEVYQLLYFTPAARPPPVLATLAAELGCPHVVLSLGSFSKIIGPGLRLGWVQASVPLIEVMGNRGYISSGGGLNPLASTLVEQLIRSGAMHTLLQSVRSALGKRCCSFATLINEALPPGTPKVTDPQGGYFLWLPLPLPPTLSSNAIPPTPTPTPTRTGAEVAAACLAAGVRVLPSFRFRCPAAVSSHPAPSTQEFLRISFAFISESLFAPAAQILTAAISGKLPVPLPPAS